jgi:hypothetical protein
MHDPILSGFRCNDTRPIRRRAPHEPPPRAPTRTAPSRTKGGRTGRGLKRAGEEGDVRGGLAGEEAGAAVDGAGAVGVEGEAPDRGPRLRLDPLLRRRVVAPIRPAAPPPRRHARPGRREGPPGGGARGRLRRSAGPERPPK